MLNKLLYLLCNIRSLMFKLLITMSFIVPVQVYAFELPAKSIQADHAPEGKADFRASSKNNTQDPTRPYAANLQSLSLVPQPNSDFLLTAVFSRNNQMHAVLNGDVVKKDDIIGTKRVVLISQSTLILNDTEVQNETTVLKLFGSTTVKTQVVK